MVTLHSRGTSYYLPFIFSICSIICFSCNNQSFKNTYCPDPSFGFDALISQGYPERNFSNIDALNLLSLTRQDTIENDSRFLIKFSFESIPLNSEIDSAFIFLRAKEPGHFGKENGFIAQMVKEDWEATEVNWENQPQSNNLFVLDIPAPKSNLQNYKIDVIDYVNNIYHSKSINYGLIFRLKNEEPPFKGIRFYSSKAKEQSNRPRLIIYYH